MTMLVWSLAAFVAVVYCFARGVVDLLGKKYLWGIAGIGSALILLFVPVQTHAVKMDLPINTGR
ncbi:hypothetical protein U1839_11170 [Sphingomonas sp. RT2P30]|uniref:hypothetical protein n=1 Tax=Parasphingomonas halimpatiens TaxID=3096162 RepID=UPI002FC73668